jgi:hypothetical protein
MKYPQHLIDIIWDLSDTDMSVSKIAKMQHLKNEQVRYVLKHKRPSQIFDYHHKDTSPTIVDKYTVDSQDVYTVDSKGDAKIETPEGNLVKLIVKFFKDFYK